MTVTGGSIRPLSRAELEDFQRDGFLIVPSMFDAAEAATLLAAAHRDEERINGARTVMSGEGSRATLSIWNEAGDDIFGLVARSNRLVEAMEALLGGEVYHYHSKISMKQPFEGGAWDWHQDYAYWYHNGCLFPYMASCMIALDANLKENGCMQVLRGSHLMGRIEHGTSGEQVGADVERVAEAAKVLDLVHCELQPGDTLFFHCNLLHRSDANRSAAARWSLICCYNAARNNPYKESSHPRYHPLHKVDDAAFMRAASQSIAAAESRGA